MNDFIYLLLNKPSGYVCSTCSDRRHTIYELLKKENCINSENSPDIFDGINPVGRLDAETTGLILLTNDGMLNHNLTIPENHVPKTYFVTLENAVTEEEKIRYSDAAKNGLILPPEKKADEYFAKNAVIEWKDEKNCLITIQEGKFHQVRRTFLALGNKVLALKRTKIGNISIPPALESGKFLILSSEQIFALTDSLLEQANFDK